MFIPKGGHLFPFITACQLLGSPATVPGPPPGKKRGHCCHPNFWRGTIKCVWNYQPNNSGPQGSSNCSKENHSVPTTTRTSISLYHWKSPTFPTSQVLPSQTYPRKYIHPQYYVQFLLKKSSLILWFCLKIWYPPQFHSVSPHFYIAYSYIFELIIDLFDGIPRFQTNQQMHGHTPKYP